MSELRLSPIGFFKSAKKNPYEAASQGSLDQSNERGLIELNPGQNFEQALKGLAEMSHVWVLFWFHHNENWKPLVMPPRGTDEKQGVFVTRSPYRPNPIGLSLVEIDEIRDRKIWVKGFDLLDGTPILDLKPFHPEADRPVSPRSGWMENLGKNEYQIRTSENFEKQTAFLNDRGVTPLFAFCLQQLRFDPFNSEKKRVEMNSDSEGVLAYRTWRIHFTVHENEISLKEIRSGYSSAELSTGEDKWKDKALHREFSDYFRG